MSDWNRRLPVRAVIATLALAACGGSDTTAPKPTAFQIVISNVGPAFSAPVQVAFDSAVARWQRIIVAALPTVANFKDSTGDCGPGFPGIGPITIQDVMIQVRFDSIDGPGKILGRSSPCFLRAAPDLRTVLGAMTFDTADIATLVSQGHINDVILHEIGHVLGFGTLWDSTYANCLKLPSDSATHVDTYYSCNRARVVFDSIGGTNYTGGNKVPVENCQGITGCGRGTVNAHWRESTFFNELMTGYLNNGVQNPLSVLSLAALQDLGYTVDLTQASPYVRTFTTSMPSVLAGSAPPLDLRDDVEHRPMKMVDNNGRVVGVVLP